MTASMSGHHSARAGSNAWLTPPGILAALGEFDLDPCAAMDPRPWDTARRHIAPPQDGLCADWSGRVWVNPPYSNVEPWLGMLADHGRGTAMVFARTETRWFADFVWSRATAVLFVYGRLHFYLPDGSRARGNAGAPTALVAYGADDADRLARSRIAGAFVALNPVTGRPGPARGSRGALELDRPAGGAGAVAGAVALPGF